MDARIVFNTKPAMPKLKEMDTPSVNLDNKKKCLIENKSLIHETIVKRVVVFEPPKPVTSISEVVHSEEYTVRFEH